jgi:D-glycero-alpha-D-manno-heptose 1-phosphate guanylyltransferase
MENICAAILAGGLGTRLRPAVGDRPKVLAQVQARPFLCILLDQLELAGIKKVVLLTGYRSSEIRESLGTQYGGMTLAYSAEPAPLGTAGALRHALPLVPSELILLLNGDSFCDLELSSLVSEHARRQADMSLTLTHVADANRFGQVEFAGDGRLTRFAEKCASNTAGWINAGVYVLSRTLVESIPDGRVVSLEKELLPNWVQQRHVFGFKATGRFLDIGTPASYAEAAAFFSVQQRGTSDSTDRPSPYVNRALERIHYAVS